MLKEYDATSICSNCDYVGARFNFFAGECTDCAGFRTIKSLDKEFISDRTYGIEFELSGQYMVDYEGWSRVEDCSINGWEYRSPVFSGYKTPIQMIQNFCQEAARDFYVEDNCGLHVHFGSDDLSEKELAKLYSNCYDLQDWFLKFANKYRRKEYCCRLEYKSFYEAIKSSTKFNWLNLSTDYDTFEVRVLDGTLDPERVERWIDLWLALIEFSRLNYLSSYQSILDVMRIMGVRHSTIEYFSKV